MGDDLASPVWLLLPIALAASSPSSRSLVLAGAAEELPRKAPLAKAYAEAAGELKVAWCCPKPLPAATIPVEGIGARFFALVELPSVKDDILLSGDRREPAAAGALIAWAGGEAPKPAAPTETLTLILP